MCRHTLYQILSTTKNVPCFVLLTTGYCKVLYYTGQNCSGFKVFISVFRSRYSLIQMKCQGGNKYALSITVKFNQSTRRFGWVRFARLFKLTKHIASLLYILSPYLLSCMIGSRNVRKNMNITKTIMKFCANWNTVCGMTNSDAGGIQTALRFRGP